MRTPKKADLPKPLSLAEAQAVWADIPEPIRDSIVQELERQERAALRDGYSDYSKGCAAVIAMLRDSK